MGEKDSRRNRKRENGFWLLGFWLRIWREFVTVHLLSPMWPLSLTGWKTFPILLFLPPPLSRSLFFMLVQYFFLDWTLDTFTSCGHALLACIMMMTKCIWSSMCILLREYLFFFFVSGKYIGIRMHLAKWKCRIA